LYFSNYNNIKVNTSGENIPPPFETFREANFAQLLNENIDKSKYTSPTPVQKYAFSIIMANRDLMACAQTGSGKTAAFMIPIIHKLLGRMRDLRKTMISMAEPRAVVVTPTRELTTQIYNQARKFANHSILKCQQLYGGTSVEFQLRQLLNGCDILVATPGRLLDMVQRNKVTFHSVEFLVLDEADKMLDMGFNEDIEKVIDGLFLYTHSTHSAHSNLQFTADRCLYFRYSATRVWYRPPSARLLCFRRPFPRGSRNSPADT
jgi:superfamily II DNA/RNA helicase